MAEIRTVTTLRAKRLEIRKTIAMYQEKLDQARADLQHISAAIAIFDGADPGDKRVYVNIDHVFKRRELAELCRKALADGPLGTNDIAKAVVKMKGMDDADPLLVKSVALRIVNNLRIQLRRGAIRNAGKNVRYRMWALPGQGEAVLPFGK